MQSAKDCSNMWWLLLVVLLLVKTYLPLLKWERRPPASKALWPVMSLALGDEVWVVLSGRKEIKQFAMAEEAVGRPDMKALYEIYSFDKPLGVIFPDGPLWREQRRFMSKTLREECGNMEEHILEEIDFCTEYLIRLANEEGVEMRDAFNLPCLNVIWRLVCGRRFEYGDRKMEELICLVEAFTMEKAMGPIAGVRYFKHIPPFRGIYQKVKGQMTTFKSFLRDFVAAEKSSINPGYISSFLSVTSGEFFSDDQLVISLLDLFTGGSGTMSKTLAFVVLYLCTNPEVQNRVQEEVDSVGEDTVRLSHRSSLPYTEATVMEVQRLGSVLPVAPPRVVAADMNVAGYNIRKGSKVQMNLYSLHRDRRHWGEDAEQFRPDRFLDDTGKVKLDEWFMPFGYGKRKCLGENVARNAVMLFVANLMRRFTFTLTEAGQGERELLLPQGGLTIGPRPFRARIQLR